MKYEEAENIVITAVKLQYCGFAQIRQFFAAQSKRLAYGDLEQILERTVVNKKLVSVCVGRYHIYCLPGKIPSKVWLDGTGKMGMKFDSEPSKNGNKPFGRPKAKIDYVAVEKAASECANDTEIAERLNVSRNTLVRRKSEDTGFSAAYNRGREKNPTVRALPGQIVPTTKIAVIVEKTAEENVMPEIEEPQKIEEIITKSITTPKASVDGDEIVITFSVAYESYLQLLTIARLEDGGTLNDVLQMAIDNFLEYDTSERRDAILVDIKHSLKNILEPYQDNFSPLEVNRNKLLEWLLKEILKDRTVVKVNEIGDLRNDLANFVAREFLQQLVPGN